MRYSRPGQRSRLLVALALCILAGAVPAEAQKLTVREVIWGFDGRAALNQFNPVSILLDNPSDEAYEGPVRLRQRTGTGRATGEAFAEEDLYIAPLGSRWVQFVPFLDSFSESGQWRLSWNGGATLLPPIRVGNNALVLISRSQGLGSGATGIRRFSEEVFPTTVAATAGLSSVVLSHVPRWEAPRRQAFEDWIRIGGQVHLLLDEDGDWPRFSENLSILNDLTGTPQQTLGRGRVFRHARTESSLTSEFPAEARALEQAAAQLSGDDSLQEDTDALKRQQQAIQDRMGMEFSNLGRGQWDAAEAFTQTLMEMTQPDHNWPLIYLLAVAYILIIFPGCYLLGRQRRHYLVTYGAILGAAAVFSLAFLIVGRRGYGERTIVNSVALLRNMDDDRWDVTQWSNAFVTRGDTYLLSHGGSGNVYAAASQHEAVNGVVARRRLPDGRVDRVFEVDIPPFSSRPFIRRAVVRVPLLHTRITRCTATSELQDLTIEIDDSFPADVTEMCVAWNRSLYALQRDGQTLRLAHHLGSPSSFIDFTKLSPSGRMFNVWYRRKDVSNAERFADLMHPLLTLYFGILQSDDALSARVPPGRIALLIYAPIPKELHLTSPEFGRQPGFALFAKELDARVTP